MKYFIKTFGCQMNTSDSERIAAFLESQNFSLADKIEDADLAIFNTCGIKQTAENRAYSMINNLRKAGKQGARIAMTGCLANRQDVQRRMQKSVDIFFAISDFVVFENWIIKNCLKIKNSKLKIQSQDSSSNQEKISYLSINPKHTNNFIAYVPIMTGCNNFCAYCVVPYARGREVSRSAQEIIIEVKDLINKGYKQITLLGQNVNSYRSPHIKKSNVQSVKSEINFSKLLKKIDSIPGKFWINFVSSHPKDMDDELIETVAKCKKVCEWIHLPIQAGDNKILEKMNRKYTKQHYLKLIKKIRKAFEIYKPDLPSAISSDIIVGFPGETKKQFMESADVMKKSKFDMVFFGQFSPRPGTAAWKMKDNVSQKEKAWRENFLNEILKKTTLANNKKYVNKKIEILIEKEKNGFYFGKTRTMKNIKLPLSKKDLLGKIVKAKITKANTWNLEGEII
jgi:tRNA-2-methylthio-N6-dimethylallyladenosine synthase